jgi:tricorn protease
MTTTNLERGAAAMCLAAAVFAAQPACAVDGLVSEPALHGDLVVFASEGDLWLATLPKDGVDVRAHRLTSGTGIESHPSFSRDGRFIAFMAEYEGNRDVYVMPATGGAPKRLTFHAGSDQPLAWSPDGARIAFRSSRANPLGRTELFWVDVGGGLADAAGFGECSLFDPQPVAGSTRFAFCRWSNEAWNWKRYRGGTAPEIWTGDLASKEFVNRTQHVANDLFPMWIGDRIYFASDRDGAMNLWSFLADGVGTEDLRRHTTFVNDATKPTDPASYGLRQPSADAAGAPRIVFAQGGRLSVLDATNDSVQRYEVELVGDRSQVRTRFVPALRNASAFSLDPSGRRVLLEARGDLVVLPVGKPGAGEQVGWRQITGDAPVDGAERAQGSREWGGTWLSDDEIVCITDAGGEQQLAVVPADGGAVPNRWTTDLSQWLMRPVASPKGTHVLFGDKAMKLHLFDVARRTTTELDAGDSGEIVDYTFSADGRWIAWSKPMANGNNWIVLRSLDGATRIDLSDGLTNDREPRFDPNGAYLWFLSDRHINPVVAGPDFEFVVPGMTELFAVPLAAATPPPSRPLAAGTDFDLDAWAKPSDPEESDDGDEEESPGGAVRGADDDEEDDDEDDDEDPMIVDAEGIRGRIWRAPLDAGIYRMLVPTFGGVLVLREPVRGIADVEWPVPPLGEPVATLLHVDLAAGETKEIASDIATFAASRNGGHVAWLEGSAIKVQPVHGEPKAEAVDLAAVQVRVEPRAEWGQIFEESWRLQRDFFWAPNMVGVDWNAMRERYRALLPLVGSRAELNDVVGQMFAELGTSHAYLMGGDDPDRPKPVPVGSLGVDFGRSGNAVTIARILPGRPGDDDLASPLAMQHLEVDAGAVLLSIDGRPVRPDRDPFELLADKAGRTVLLEIADDVQGNGRRTIEVTARPEDESLRYAAWVDANRRAVEEMSGGRLGYVHIPDMDTAGLVEFTRTFFAQTKKDGMIVDVRNNGGGWVSQLVLARIARTPWAYSVPRQGRIESYPSRVLDGPFAVLIDQDAGSDGDIFPASVRLRGIAPLIGTRTWGGVVGIRGDKPSIDSMVTTQPEYAWLDPSKEGTAAWSLENEGVAPDIEIDITPADRLAGRDPQLEKGVSYLLERLRTNPRPAPSRPPYPDRSGVGR